MALRMLKKLAEEGASIMETFGDAIILKLI
jgi:hypothetical protein